MYMYISDDFMKVKDFDKNYLDYERAKALVRRFYTADQLNGARLSLVMQDFTKKLRNENEQDISAELFGKACREVFELGTTPKELPNARTGRMGTEFLFYPTKRSF